MCWEGNLLCNTSCLCGADDDDGVVIIDYYRRDEEYDGVE